MFILMRMVVGVKADWLAAVQKQAADFAGMATRLANPCPGAGAGARPH